MHNEQSFEPDESAYPGQLSGAESMTARENRCAIADEGADVLLSAWPSGHAGGRATADSAPARQPAA